MPQPSIARWIAIVAFLTLALTDLAHSDVKPANRSVSGDYALRNLSLGEPRFSNPDLYNLYDQGGSPMGLLETHRERMNLSAGLLSSNRSTSGDSLRINHGDYNIPQFGFFQPGAFGAVLYFNRESESYYRKGGDSVDVGRTRFGLDLAAGPASGLFRIGFSAHAALGSMEYPGEPSRILLDLPSLRLDLGSRPVSGVEIGVFTGISAHFDSLETLLDRHERVASMTLPRYGILADIGGDKKLPFMGNTALELGTDRFLGEYRQVNQAGVEYPIVWTGYWDFRTQWLYSFQVDDFQLEPSFLFAKRSEDAQGYAGIKANQNPFHKGAKLPAMAWKAGATSFGLGGHVRYREGASMLMEWETTSRSFDLDSNIEKRYDRFSAGVECNLDRWEALRLPKVLTLALRIGWTWSEEEKNQPGFRALQFDPFLPSPQVPTRLSISNPLPQSPVAYKSIHLGFGLGLLDDRLTLDGLLSFPGQLEEFTPARTKSVDGTEIGLTTAYRVF